MGKEGNWVEKQEKREERINFQRILDGGGFSSIKQRAPDFRLHGNAPKGGKSRLQKTSKKWCAKYLYSFLLKKKKKNLETYKTYIKRKTILFVQYVSSQ